jgi:hypothetical protein
LALSLAASVLTEQKRRPTTDSKRIFFILISLAVPDIRGKLIARMDSKNFIHPVIARV